MRIDCSVPCDVLVVGSGLAGLRATYDIAHAGMRVLLVSKGKLCSGASFYPLTGGLGAQLPSDDADKVTYLDELLDSGDGIADPKLCSIMVEEVSKEVERLADFGIRLSTPTGRAACFAKRERVLKVWSGWEEIRTSVRSVFSTLDSVHVWEYADVVKLLKKDGKIAGAVVVDSTGEAVFVRTCAVILATGGYCGLYKHSLNTDDVCGIGHSLALDAGAKLINLEFMQFIPGLVKPVYKLLFGEFSLKHCDTVTDTRGRDGLSVRLPPDVSWAQCLHDRSMHGPFTTRDASKWFDIAMMEQSIAAGCIKGFKIRYKPSILTDSNELMAGVRDLYASRGIDLVRNGIEIAPFAHCANGGIWIDEQGQTSVQGLFAAGEAAGGIHGADRHGGAATAVCLVFGARAAKSAIAHAREHASLSRELSLATVEHEFEACSDTGSVSDLDGLDVLHDLAHLLWMHANVVRGAAGLSALRDWVAMSKSRYNLASILRSGADVKQSCKAFHALRTAEAVVASMLHRTESRGPHYRHDHPERNPSLYGLRTVVSEHDGTIAAVYH